MQDRVAPVMILLVLGLAATPSLADTWCSQQGADTVFCDDFDRYCASPPPYPQECGLDWDTTLLRSTWVPSGTCTLELVDLYTSWNASPPASLLTSSVCWEALGYSQRSFSSQVKSRFGSTCAAVAGTDVHPLVLEFVMDGFLVGDAMFTDSYLELSHGGAQDLTDWAYSTEWCTNCKGGSVRYPIICQQEAPGTNCPPISQAPHRSSIAAGFVAHLDNNPCHPGESDARPRNPHLAFFDGYKWYSLRSGLFPGSGDFLVREFENVLKITIRSTTFKVELTCPARGEYSQCVIPRDYMGGFTTMSLGYKNACRLNSGTWSCDGSPSCVYSSGYAAAYDNVILRGGTCSAAPGACCYADTTCAQEVAGDCVTLGGTPAGAGTRCGEVPCCPPRLPDHDMDNDVDVEDFGWFQTCLSDEAYAPAPTVACRCADLDYDGDVDRDDFTRFHQCLSGAGIAPPQACPH